MLKKSSILFLLFVIVVQLSFTQSSFAQTQLLTMEEAISRALAKNNSLKASKYALHQAEWNQKQAWAQLFPVLSFNTRYTWIDAQTFAERDFRRYLPPDLAKDIPQTVFQESYYSSFDISMPLFDGILFNGLRIASANKQMLKRMNTSTRKNIIFQVVQAYLNVMHMQKMLELQKEYLTLSNLNYLKAKRLFNTNRYSETETLRWKVDLEQQKSNVANTEANLRSSKILLNRLINAKFNANFKLEKEIPPSIVLEFEKIISLNSDAILSMINISDNQLIELNDALAAQKKGTEISKLNYQNSYSSFLPTIRASYSYGWRENGTIAFDDYSPKTFMINLRVPIFSGFQNYTKLKSSYYTFKEQEEKFNDQIKNTRYLLNEAVNKILNLKTQINLAKYSAKLSKKNYEIVELQKSKGLISNIDFIDAKLNYQNSELNLTNTKYNFISAILEFYYLTGRIETILN